MQVTIAHDGEDALQTLLNNPNHFDLILMDIQMPKLDGYRTTQAIRQNLKLNDIPIIAMTAHAMKDEKQLCLEYGMNDHIAKPISLKTLWEALNRWLPPPYQSV